ncbi:hypothetical protein BDN71DRAFT_1459201 [Pleurotus eryngii]|uniref:Uncharacterized protein n=1 Tax=Pleurotus eryngii TaxID=5323 RepID=A0A9P5ZFA5_PLEER|nr:hypothetical protein BDN71DRAFT_1459201 [Pleurotus eryngii]
MNHDILTAVTTRERCAASSQQNDDDGNKALCGLCQAHSALGMRRRRPRNAETYYFARAVVGHESEAEDSQNVAR